ncbi:hypothetical protein FRC01_008994 [Tulasnella sp. 417]|nr:hypothetical protein FRC01_008994 [Tulasnella sp. 417]
MTMDEAIFAVEGWPGAEIDSFERYYEAVNYLNLEPMEYPLWFRVIIWPKTAGDARDPAIPEASAEEFSDALDRMLKMGYPKNRFPAWFIEKVQGTGRHGGELWQAPVEAPIRNQSEWIAHFGPAYLTQPHPRYGMAADYAVTLARAFAARARSYPRFHASAIQRQDSSQSPDGDSPELRVYEGDLICSRITSWRASIHSRSDELAKSASGASGATNIGSDAGEKEVQPIWWTFPSARLTLILGAPGRVENRAVKEFIPGTQSVDLWGIDNTKCPVDIVDDCLGPSANRYFDLHYYSQGSKAIIVQAYCYHHQDTDQFIKHLFRSGVLPMLGIYIWELLKTSFNWGFALKAEIGKKIQGTGGASRLIHADKLDFGPCLECRDQGALILSLKRECVPVDDKGKGSEEK